MKLLIFTYAPTGLGHLRVTDALVSSRPQNMPYILLGSIDKFAVWIHRFTSINPLGKYIFLKSQYGLFEDIFTSFYRRFLITTAGSLFKQLKQIIKQSPDRDEVWIIATHFGMAHQIGAIKEKLSKETEREIRLVVQVTDDTSQHIWCIRGADLTLVPSEHVRDEFREYTKAQGMEFKGEVIPYPLSPILTKKLPKGRGKRSTVFAEKTGTIKVAVPISGAAVGLNYLTKLIKELSRSSERFEFWVLVKKTPFTELFIASVSGLSGVNVLIGKNDREMIALYELLYEKNLIHLEVTKPSEQAFKAILSPSRVGGSILLFSAPIGRQEIENIEFLARHKLVLNSEEGGYARAMKLAEDPREAAQFIQKAVESGLFAKMTAENFKFSPQAMGSGEIGADGARQFWKKVFRAFGK